MHPSYSKEDLHGINQGIHICLEKHIFDRIQHLRLLKKANTSRGKNNKYNLLKILNWNIEGFKNATNCSPEKNLFKDADLIILTETLNTDDLIQIPGYYRITVPAEKPDVGRPVGGIAIFYKPFLNLNQVNVKQNRIHANSSIGTILCYYFNPETNIEDIVEDLTEDLSNIENETCIIAGDFNCRMDTTNQKGSTLLEKNVSLLLVTFDNPV
ncbi:hypothetical protein M8J77_018542 [Diaphorina citri]|nr:hypothetical protein M8J77_018542 [Diaphorina citri]